jgi:1-deoxy-D-xylulose-5-phosphate reductoisomerase
MNAANEAAVAAFLDRRIGFLDIAATVAQTLELMDASGDLAPRGGGDVLETAMNIDKMARDVAANILQRGARVH